MTMTTFLTSDSHFGHANVIKFCGRPFASTEQMDREMIGRWNDVVDKRDVVYHLGDFTLRDSDFARSILEQLNGTLCILSYPWHHDRRWIEQAGHMHTKHYAIQPMPPLLIVRFNRTKFTLCHFPMAAWQAGHYGQAHCHGHVHNNGYVDPPGSYNVCVEMTDYTPVTLESIWEIHHASEL